MEKKIQFYDLKAKDYFKTANYKVKTIIVKGNKKKYAVALSPISKKEYWKVLPKEFKK